MEFFKNVGKFLIILNFSSVLFLTLTIFVYSFIQYGFGAMVSITQLLFTEESSRNLLYRILDLALLLPKYLDYLFLMLIIVSVLNVFYIAWKTEKGNLYVTLAFSLIGLPTFIYFINILDNIKDWAIGFLSSAITYHINMTFFTYIQNNNIYFSIIVFIIAIGIRSIDWQNIKEFTFRTGLSLDNSDNDINLNDKLKQ